MACGLAAQCRISGYEDFSLRYVGFQQPFLGALQDEAQTVQVVKATATAEQPAKALLDEARTTFQFQM